MVYVSIGYCATRIILSESIMQKMPQENGVQSKGNRLTLIKFH